MHSAILLAEDSTDDERFFKRILKSLAVTNPVKVVRNGVEAIAYLSGEGPYADRKQFPLPSVLFLDLVMPRMDGFQVLQWIRAHTSLKEMLIVVLTHFNEGRMLRDAYALGADSFLFKPFSKYDLENLLEHFPGHLTTSRKGEPKTPRLAK